MDVSTTQNSNCFCWKEIIHPGFSFKKSCFFLLIFLLITFVLVGLATCFVILIMKPHKPVFSLRDVKINFYQTENHSDNITLFVSSVISLTFNAENHNKFGIGYSPSRFLVYHEGLNIGTIRIPWFFQPPHSDDVRVPSRVLLQCVNVSKIIGKASSTQDSKQNKALMKIIGDARVHVWILHTKLLHIKIALDCDMSINLRDLSFTSEVYSSKLTKSDLASVLTKFNGISMKCASSVNV